MWTVGLLAFVSSNEEECLSPQENSIAARNRLAAITPFVMNSMTCQSQSRLREVDPAIVRYPRSLECFDGRSRVTTCDIQELERLDDLVDQDPVQLAINPAMVELVVTLPSRISFSSTPGVLNF